MPARRRVPAAAHRSSHREPERDRRGRRPSARHRMLARYAAASIRPHSRCSTSRRSAASSAAAPAEPRPRRAAALGPREQVARVVQRARDDQQLEHCGYGDHDAGPDRGRFRPVQAVTVSLGTRRRPGKGPRGSPREPNGPLAGPPSRTAGSTHSAARTTYVSGTPNSPRRARGPASQVLPGRTAERIPTPGVGRSGNWPGTNGSARGPVAAHRRRGRTEGSITDRPIPRHAPKERSCPEPHGAGRGPPLGRHWDCPPRPPSSSEPESSPCRRRSPPTGRSRWWRSSPSRWVRWRWP